MIEFIFFNFKPYFKDYRLDLNNFSDYFIIILILKRSHYTIRILLLTQF